MEQFDEEQFDADLKCALSALTELFSADLSDKFDNLVDEGEYNGEAILDDIEDEHDSNIIEGLQILNTNSTQLKLFCDLMIQIFKDHNYDINTALTVNNNDKYIKDMDLNEFMNIICTELESLNVNSYTKDVLKSILAKDSYNGYKFYSTMNQPKNQLTFCKLLKQCNIPLGKAREIWKRIKKRIENEIDECDNNNDDKKLDEMDCNQFITHLINEATTNDKIYPKLGVKFDKEKCKQILLENKLTFGKVQGLGKKEFMKLAKIATIISGPANKLYRTLLTRHQQENAENEENNDNITPLQNIEHKSNTETIEHKSVENVENKSNEQNTAELDAEFDINSKECIDMSFDEFRKVILHNFHEKVPGYSDETISAILLSENMDYDRIMSMKSNGFSALMKSKLNLKKGQSVGIYKLITKRIEFERQKSFVPIMKTQISSSLSYINKQQTQKVLDLLEKDKEIDLHFVRDTSKRHIFENKLKSKVPSIKTGQAIAIYNALHELVDGDDIDFDEIKEEEEQEPNAIIDDDINDDKEEKEVKQITIDNNTEPKPEVTDIKLEDLTATQMAPYIMQILQENQQIDMNHVPFDKLNELILNLNISGLKYQAMSRKEFSDLLKTNLDIPHGVNAKIMQIIKQNSMKSGGPSPTATSPTPPKSLRVHIEMNGISGYISKLNEYQLSKMTKMVIDESLNKLFQQITNGIHANAINGAILLDNLIDKKADEFLTFFAKNIHNKCSKFALDLYLIISNNDNKIAKIRNKSSVELCKYIIYTFTQKIGELIVEEEIDGYKYLELGKGGFCRKLNEYLSFGLSRRLVGNIDHYINEAYKLQINQNKMQMDITPRQSLSEKTDFFESSAIIREEEEEEEKEKEGAEQEDSTYSQTFTIDLSKATHFLNHSNMSMLSNNNSVKPRNKEEEELASFAVQIYKKYNKKSLENVRRNVYKCDLSKLLPHIIINETNEIQIVKKGKQTTMSLSFGPKLAVKVAQYEEDEDEDEDNNNGLTLKGQNLNGNVCQLSVFTRFAKSIYKMNEKENFYHTLYDDVMKENNGFVNILSKYEIQEWLVGYECNRIKHVICAKHIDFKQFRILSQNKVRDEINYLGFLPKKRRKKLYDALVKYISKKK